MRLILVLCLLAPPAWACTVKDQAALLTAFSSCASRGLPEGCISPSDIQDLVCSIPTLATAAVPTMASTGFTAFTTTQGTATLTNTTAGVTISDTDQGADTIRAACKNAPTPPYTLTGLISLTASYGPVGDSWGGLAWRDSTNGHIIGYGILASQGAPPPEHGTPTVWSIDFSTPTTFAGTSEGQVFTYAPTIWIQISDTGTTAIQRYSMDGVNFLTLSSVAKAAGYLGSAGYKQVCFFASAHGSDAKATLRSYAESSP